MMSSNAEADPQKIVDLPRMFQGQAADVTDGTRIAEVIAEVERILGPITLLVNNAGTSSASGRSG